MTKSATLSIASTPSVSSRLTAQTLSLLTFIHRFRHVTARHVQIYLGHTTSTTTTNRLRFVQSKGLIARHYGSEDRARNRPASYFLTQAGLDLLSQKYPHQRFRPYHSVRADATGSQRWRERCHLLADVYVHCKRHYAGRFEFFGAFDIAGLEYMPDETPDGYVRITVPGSGVQHYLIEIVGTGRSSYVQQRRLHSYLQFAESERWQLYTGHDQPNLFLVVGSQGAQKRLHGQLGNMLAHSLAEDFRIYSTTYSKLNGDRVAIWREMQ